MATDERREIMRAIAEIIDQDRSKSRRIDEAVDMAEAGEAYIATHEEEVLSTLDATVDENGGNILAALDNLKRSVSKEKGLERKNILDAIKKVERHMSNLRRLVDDLVADSGKLADMLG